MIAVCLSDRTACVCPTVPYMAMQIVHVIRFFLPDPKYFVNCRLKIGFSERYNRKFFRKIISVYDTKLLDGMSGRAVSSYGSDFEFGIPNPVIKNISTRVNENFICFTHISSSVCVACFYYGIRFNFRLLLRLFKFWLIIVSFKLYFYIDFKNLQLHFYIEL